MNQRSAIRPSVENSPANRARIGIFLHVPPPQNSDPAPEHARFLRLYSAHEAPLRAFVRSMLPSRQEADEVMQEVVVALWTHFETASDFRPWAYAVARNQTLMYLRRRARDRHIFDESLLSQLADRQSSLTERHNAQREALTHCLRRLTPPQRDLILAAYQPDTQIQDLARTRSETPMALYKKLHRIRLTLLACVRRILNQEELA